MTALPPERGQFATPNASRYLQQLCKHFAHKLPVDFTPEAGTITFPFGVASVTAHDNVLRVEVAVDSDDTRARAREVVDKHLKRFAFREDFEELTWES